MSEQIDWSKAPEGAMVLLKHVRDGAYAVSESYGDEAKTWHWPDPRYSFPLMPSMWRIVAERPTTPSWSGEGLPPVGVVCEVDWCEEWHKCEVIAHFQQRCGMVAAFTVEISDGVKSLYAFGADSFRPIRTPEQIAADEREAAILDMERICRIGDFGSGGLAALYDAGYRKAEVNDAV